MGDGPANAVQVRWLSERPDATDSPEFGLRQFYATFTLTSGDSP